MPPLRHRSFPHLPIRLVQASCSRVAGRLSCQPPWFVCCNFSWRVNRYFPSHFGGRGSRRRPNHCVYAIVAPVLLDLAAPTPIAAATRQLIAGALLARRGVVLGPAQTRHALELRHSLLACRRAIRCTCGSTLTARHSLERHTPGVAPIRPFTDALVPSERGSFTSE